MPDAHKQIPEVIAAMRPDAKLLLFCPQITQILDAVKLSKESALPLVLEQVLELGMGLSGGRPWDVRLTPKPTQPAVENTAMASPSLLQRLRRLFVGSAPTATVQKQEWFEVCKPKLGERTVNGGFVALWGKMDPLE